MILCRTASLLSEAPPISPIPRPSVRAADHVHSYRPRNFRPWTTRGTDAKVRHVNTGPYAAHWDRESMRRRGCRRATRPIRREGWSLDHPRMARVRQQEGLPRSSGRRARPVKRAFSRSAGDSRWTQPAGDSRSAADSPLPGGLSEYAVSARGGHHPDETPRSPRTPGRYSFRRGRHQPTRRVPATSTDRSEQPGRRHRCHRRSYPAQRTPGPERDQP